MGRNRGLNRVRRLRDEGVDPGSALSAFFGERWDMGGRYEIARNTGGADIASAIARSRVDADREKLSPSDRRRQTKKISEVYRSQTEKLRENLTESLSNILLGEKIPLDVINSESGEIIIPANRKITRLHW